jgi:toxin FitB
MSAYLLDTNIVSELRRRERVNPGLRSWFEGVENGELYLSVMTLGEVRKGIERLRPRDPAQAVVLERWLNTLERSFADRVLSIDADAADQWGKLQAIRPLPEIDALIAATCIRDDLTLVTRNDADFKGLGIRVLNPFS